MLTAAPTQALTHRIAVEGGPMTTGAAAITSAIPWDVTG